MILSSHGIQETCQSSSAPGGRPDLLFHIPSASGYSNQGLLVDSTEISIAENVMGIDHHPVFKNKDLHDLLICYMGIHHLQAPMDAQQSLETYVQLLGFLRNDGFIV